MAQQVGTPHENLEAAGRPEQREGRGPGPAGAGPDGPGSAAGAGPDGPDDPERSSRGAHLRARKRTRTKRLVQDEALRLFAERGYDRTTIDDIAHAAAMSPRTFFRYFRTKEDVVLWDEYDEIGFEDEMWRPKEGVDPVVHLVSTIRFLLTDAYRNDREQMLARIRLAYAVPEVRARFLDQQIVEAGAVFDQFVQHLRWDADEMRIRAIVAGLYGAILIAVHRWVAGDGREDLGKLYDEAIAALADGMAGLNAALPTVGSPGGRPG